MGKLIIFFTTFTIILTACFRLFNMQIIFSDMWIVTQIVGIYLTLSSFYFISAFCYRYIVETGTKEYIGFRLWFIFGILSGLIPIGGLFVGIITWIIIGVNLLCEDWGSEKSGFRLEPFYKFYKFINIKITSDMIRNFFKNFINLKLIKVKVK